MSLQKTDDFLADVERQFEWYLAQAGWEVADGYLSAIEATCRLLEQHPFLGPCGSFKHARLRAWRFFVVFRPFNKHVLFYEVADDAVLMRRALHGHRELPVACLNRPEADPCLAHEELFWSFTLGRSSDTWSHPDDAQRDRPGDSHSPKRRLKDPARGPRLIGGRRMVRRPADHRKDPT